MSAIARSLHREVILARYLSSLNSTGFVGRVPSLKTSQDVKIEGAPQELPPLASIGTKVDHVDVVLNTRFFELFSKNLYRSPNKAFEELVANSWDAGASSVYIGIPSNLADPKASVWILDNGESMDAAGLKALWRIASSSKSGRRHGREQIGKFGIGKLATYLLAQRLTYVCKGSDGVIRLVEMDYADVERAGTDASAGRDLLVGTASGVALPLNELTKDEFSELLTLLPEGKKIDELIKKGVPKAKLDSSTPDEFGRADETTDVPSGTWTLAIMTTLKELGKQMQLGWIRYMMRSALPLGDSMSLVFNGEVLSPTKVDLQPEREIFLDERISFKQFRHDDPENPLEKKMLAVTAHTQPFPHVTIEGFDGPVTGTVRRYPKSISGKKSDELGRSNGYFVNVLGRVVNSEEPYFGLENLSHSVWAQFRMCVRADGLNEFIGINREQLHDDERLRVFRSFLLEAFNQMRREVDDPLKNAWRDAGKLIGKSWGAIPLRSFHRALRLYSEDGKLPDAFLVTEGADIPTLVEQWTKDVQENPASGLKDVEFRKLDSNRPLFAFDLERRTVVVNADHPFMRMHGRSEAEQAVLRDVAVAETLATARLTDIGVPEELIADYQDYKDQLYRILTLVQRDSGVTIAQNLLTYVDDEKALELLVGSALEFLGYEVDPMGESGEPEGVAYARLHTSEKRSPANYSLTYEAKSTAKARVSAEKVGVSVVDKHRDDKKTDYVLVVAKDFSDGMLAEMCLKAKVTPMRANDLARLLLLAAGTGAPNLEHLRRLYANTDPNEVSKWVNSYIEQSLKEQRITLNDILNVVGEIKVSNPDKPISADVIAYQLRLNAVGPYDLDGDDIIKLFQGLRVLVPSLCLVVHNDVYLGTSPKKFKEAVLQQISVIPPEFRFALDQISA